MASLSNFWTRIATGAKRLWATWLRFLAAEESRWRADVEGDAAEETPAEGSKGCDAAPRPPSLMELVSERQEEARHAGNHGGASERG